jgi:hypothetical protein
MDAEFRYTPDSERVQRSPAEMRELAEFRTEWAKAPRIKRRQQIWLRFCRLLPEAEGLRGCSFDLVQHPVQDRWNAKGLGITIEEYNARTLLALLELEVQDCLQEGMDETQIKSRLKQSWFVNKYWGQCEPMFDAAYETVKQRREKGLVQ